MLLFSHRPNDQRAGRSDADTARLGPHEDRIREILKTDQALDPETYSSILIHPIGQRYPGTIFRPWRDRIEATGFYRLYFPDVIALIKVD